MNVRGVKDELFSGLGLRARVPKRPAILFFHFPFAFFDAVVHFLGSTSILGEMVTSKYIFYTSCVAKTTRKLPPAKARLLFSWYVGLSRLRRKTIIRAPFSRWMRSLNDFGLVLCYLRVEATRVHGRGRGGSGLKEKEMEEEGRER